MLGVLLLAVVATAVVLLVDRLSGDDTSTATPRAAQIAADGSVGDGLASVAVSTAQLAARTYYGLDGAHPQRSVQRMRSVATPAFARAYAAKVAQLPRAERTGVQVATDAPDGTATEYLSATSARVLVVLDVRRRVGGATSSTMSVALRVTLVRDGESWRVDGLRVVG